MTLSSQLTQFCLECTDGTQTTLDLWDEWTNDKVDSYLIAELVYFEDRNTAFNMTIVMVVIFMIGAVVTVFMSGPTPPTVWAIHYFWIGPSCFRYWHCTSNKWSF